METSAEKAFEKRGLSCPPLIEHVNNCSNTSFHDTVAL